MNEPLKHPENHPQYSRAQADCFEILPVVPSGSVDLIITDPPYGITACDWDIKPDIPRFFSEAWRVLKPNGACIVFGTVKSGLDWIIESRKEFRYEMVWEKSNSTCFVKANEMPLRIHEMIFVFFRSKPTFNPQRYMPEKPKAYTRRFLSCKNQNFTSTKGYDGVYDGSLLYKSVLKFGNFNGAGYDKGHSHSTQKPVPLMNLLIQMYTNEGETVLDPFMGSGSTGVACINTGRKFIGIEKDVHFFEVADKRIQSAIDNYQHKLPFFDD